MSVFGKLATGVRARRTIVLPLPGATFDIETGKWTGDVDMLDIRPLRADEHTLVLERARVFAVQHGVDAPEDADELYERGKILHTLAIACLDRESTVSDPKPYFEGGWEQIHSSELLSTDVLLYLVRQQELWQDECSPIREEMSPEQYLTGIASMAEGHLDFFDCMRPRMQRSFSASMARQLQASMTAALRSTSSPSPLPIELTDPTASSDQAGA